MILKRRTLLHGLLAFPASGLLGRAPQLNLIATVYNGPELATALSAAGPGSTVTLAPGDYGDVGSQLVLSSGGIKIRAEAPQHAVLRTALVVQGDEVDLDGLAFAEGVHLIGNGLRIAGSRFAGQTLKISGVGTEVTGCEFTGYPGKMLYVGSTARSPYIHHNEFHDGGSCAIYVGSGMNTNSVQMGARVEANTIRNITGGNREVICVKSSGNLIVGNTISLGGRSGYLSNRHGRGNEWRSNVVNGGYGIRNQDGPNRYIGNSAPTLAIMAGNVVAAGIQGTWPTSRDVYVEGNQGLLRVGATYSGFTVPASGTHGSHDGPISYDREVNTSIS